MQTTNTPQMSRYVDCLSRTAQPFTNRPANLRACQYPVALNESASRLQIKQAAARISRQRGCAPVKVVRNADIDNSREVSFRGKKTKIAVKPTFGTNASPSDREDTRTVREAAQRKNLTAAVGRAIKRQNSAWSKPLGYEREAEIRSKIIERDVTSKRSDSHLRDTGSNSLVDIYKNDTPGQVGHKAFRGWKEIKRDRAAAARASTVSPNQRGYTPKMSDEKRFAALHKTRRLDDRAGNQNSHFQGVTKPYPRKKNRMGYDPRHDQDAEFVAGKSRTHREVATEQVTTPKVSAGVKKVVRRVLQNMKARRINCEEHAHISMYSLIPYQDQDDHHYLLNQRLCDIIHDDSINKDAKINLLSLAMATALKNLEQQYEEELDKNDRIERTKQIAGVTAEFLKDLEQQKEVD